MNIPNMIKDHHLLGIGFDEDGKVWGKYYRRTYCGRINAAPEYAFWKEGDEEGKIRAFSPVKRFAIRPCEFCGKPNDGHDC